MLSDLRTLYFGYGSTGCRTTRRGTMRELDKTAMGRRIREIRLGAGLRQWELARILGTTQSAIHKYEHGVVPEPRRLIELCDVGQNAPQVLRNVLDDNLILSLELVRRIGLQHQGNGCRDDRGGVGGPRHDEVVARPRMLGIGLGDRR